eukprot:CAMPEP_0174747474 /NCGR_PEP_ID=MMETSP1094-20130205/91290_1 /TAXON_ID=156173 /ORGANISM="Chrysochromulina brevifilum, Strain UTEX LB 985" /LENGTH=51 /DNA_ID=CAMNT_0015952357 /DNA_START=220 /DNA_END=375 /DNA_ORIENTATION=-
MSDEAVPSVADAVGIGVSTVGKHNGIQPGRPVFIFIATIAFSFFSRLTKDL